MAGAPLTQCGTHGKRIAAVVCKHMLVNSKRAVGFIENSSDPDDLQAWCDVCEEKFMEEGGLTLAFEEFNDRKIVCNLCYALIKERHTRARPAH
jgi:hypothetical protein